ncbi:MAG: hypothetical protein M3Z66_18180 [Chloroflexota bacterium]|nr:hypothetical protein [Chloroflexota bacterium]
MLVGDANTLLLYTPSPTSVRVTSVHIQIHGRYVIARWRMKNASGVIGFNLKDGARTLNRRLIPIHHSATYQFRAIYTGHARLKVEVVDKDGHKTEQGVSG